MSNNGDEQRPSQTGCYLDLGKEVGQGGQRRPKLEEEAGHGQRRWRAASIASRRLLDLEKEVCHGKLWRLELEEVAVHGEQ